MGFDGIIIGKNIKALGIPPGVILSNPKYAHNVGAAMRACSCYGISQLIFTGDRVAEQIEMKKRVPREERMKGYSDVQLITVDYPFDIYPRGTPFVCVEIGTGYESLFNFIHPEKAVYVFGPEDGSVPKTFRSFCHKFVTIPSRHCLNLAAAVYTVLYDRMLKQYQDGIAEEMAEMSEFYCDLENE